MLLAFASAPDRPFLIELIFDAALPGNALLASKIVSSALVIIQHISCEHQMSFLATLAARVRVDISWAEATFRACKAHRVTLVHFGVLQHSVVERVSGPHLFANVAASGIRLALALDALFRVAFEAFWELLHAAPGAGMAR